MLPSKQTIINAFQIFPGLLEPQNQSEIVSDLREVVRQAPLRTPTTPGGKAMSVQMSSSGDFGWLSDRLGYRYSNQQPDGQSWPEIPRSVRAVWDRVVAGSAQPECCLINYYGAGAKMGLHQDKDEQSFAYPVVSISLGDDGLFRMGGPSRKGPTKSIWLKSGDVVVMSGAARLAFHGIDKIRFGSSTLLRQGGRLNVTLRVVS